MYKTLILSFMVANVISYRLQDTIRPLKYNLTILVNLGNIDNKFNFNGNVSITIQCKKSTNKIILHSKGLMIEESNVAIIDTASESKEVFKHDYMAHFDWYIITLHEDLTAGQIYILTIPFKGDLNKGLSGFYRSSYLGLDEEPRWLASTQFAPSEARTAFPCFDEPMFKTVFHIKIGHINELNSVSSTALVCTEDMPKKVNWVTDLYEPTRKLSTSSIAFVVADYEATKIPSNVTSFGINLFTREDAVNQTEFVSVVIPEFVAFCEAFLGVKYPFNKLDIVTIQDFSNMATGYAGFILIGESGLLYDTKISSFSNLKYISDILAREIARQWFGNFVTPVWWSEVWLSDALSTYVSQRAVDGLFPEWSSLNQNLVADYLNILEVDAYICSHPVSMAIDEANLEVQTLDTITYNKGSFLVRMMNNLLGEQIFKKGLQRYLNKYKYSTSDTNKLFAVFNKVKSEAGIESHISMASIMDLWAEQTGYPVITVDQSQPGSIALTQNRFLYENNEFAEKSCWFIYLSYRTARHSRLRTVSLSCELKTSDITIDNDEWILFNADMTSLVRINYNLENWLLLSKTLHSPKYTLIDVLSRVQIIDDLFNFARAGYVTYELTLKLTSYLQYEKEFLPWVAAAFNLKYLQNRLVFTEGYGTLVFFIQNTLNNLYIEMKNNNIPGSLDNFEMLEFKNLVMNMACEYEISSCVPDMITWYQHWFAMDNKDTFNPIPREIRSAVYSTAMKHLKDEEWEFLWCQVINTNVESERLIMLEALGKASNPKTLKDYLEHSLINNSSLRLYEVPRVFKSVATQPLGYKIAVHFFIQNFHQYYKLHKNKLVLLSEYIEVLANFISSDEEFDLLEEFFLSYKHLLLVNQQVIALTLERARINLEWNRKYAHLFGAK